jgi:hypothetical protein
MAPRINAIEAQAKPLSAGGSKGRGSAKTLRKFVLALATPARKLKYCGRISKA